MQTLLTPLLLSAAGAFLAAWMGALLAFRKGKKERALDRRIDWHENLIESLASYEEQLERIWNEARGGFITGQLGRTKKGKGEAKRPGELRAAQLPRHMKLSAQDWNLIAETESRVRGAMRLADLFVSDERLRLECSTALRTSLSLVHGNVFAGLQRERGVPWLDLNVRAFQISTLRRKLQESLGAILELEGVLAALLGRKYRMWRTRRRLDRVGRELAAESERFAARQAQTEAEERGLESVDSGQRAPGTM